MIAQTNHTIRANGIRQNYIDAGAGAPIVLLHGFPETNYAWRHQIPVLGELYRIIAPDLRGETDKPASGYDKRTLLGVRPTLVPFAGTGPATNALLSGQVDYMCNGIPEAGPHIQAGTLKAYAVGTAGRNPTIPNVPTSKEAGLPEFQASPWFALFAPKGAPQAARDQLSDAIDKALDDPSVRKRLFDGDIPPKAARGQQQLAALVKNEIARWTPIIKATNVKGE